MYHVGSKNEPKGRTGFAHLFEHLLFQGSEHVGESEHFKYVQDAGGTLNGSTWFDRTNYFETLPASRLDLALWLESDRMGWFLTAITAEKLDNQRDVVKNERRQSYENRPYGLAVETVLREAYPEGHPYRHPTIGYMEDLDAATLADVKQFFRTWYAPGNAVLVLVGDFERAEAMRRVQRYFDEIPVGAEPVRAPVPDDVSMGERRAVLEDRVQVPRVYMMFHAPPFPDADWETARVVASLLAEGRSSRLYHDLVYDKQVAGEVYAWTWPLEKAGMLWLVATARPGVSAAGLEAAIDETLDGLIREAPRREEITGARNRMQRSLITDLRSTGQRADALAHAAVLKGDPGYVNEAFGMYAAVGPRDVERLASGMLLPGNRTVLHVVPEAGR
jgi:predicted Zn-dependent peptidase